MRLLTFLCLIAFYSKSQSADTLLPSFLSIPNDTERVNQLYKKGFSLRNSEPNTAFQFAHYCEQSALASKSEKHLAKSYNLLGILFYKKGDFKKAIHYHKEALQLRQRCNDVLGTAFSLTNLGNIYVDLKLYHLAENNHLSALEVYQQLKDETRIANCLINIGILKQEMKQHDAAYEHYKLAYQIGNKLNDYDIRSICLNNIAVTYYYKGNYEKAISYNEDALELRNLMDNAVEVTDSYINLASCYIQLHEPQKARENLDTAISLSNYFDYYEARQEALKVSADYFYLVKDYQKAFECINRYYTVHDSVLAEENNAHFLLDFEEPLNNNHNSENTPNLWMLLLLISAIILIPFYLVKYKR